jgi:hypothetical protein
MANAASANDSMCRKQLSSTKKPSTKDLLRYQTCRDDLQDAALKRIEDRLSAGSLPTGTAPAPSTVPTRGATPTQTPPPPSQAPASGALALPRVPWEGGPDYYKQFSGSSAYTNPKVFPVVAWWASFDSDANVKWDKDHGINTYTQLNPNSPGNLLAPNNMNLIQGNNDAGRIKGIDFKDPHWVGWWLSDETDGRFDPPARGHEQIQKEIDAQKEFCASSSPCKFAYANYTGIVTSAYNDTQIAADEKYVNMFAGPVSVDGYYYTDPSCDDPGRKDWQVNAPDNAHCRTSAAYGNFIRNLRTRDQVDGKLKPLYGFVENGAPTGSGISITPQQEQGAVWSMIRNEARGIVWFNQSFSGPCQSGNVLRDAQANPDGCNAARVEGMKTVNLQVQALAPVLNTQSYAWDVKAAGTETMLKVKDGYAYLFAGVDLNGQPGSRTMTLPPEVKGATVEVVNENRTLPVSGGKITDSFAKEYTNHIYKVSLS